MAEVRHSSVVGPLSAAGDTPQVRDAFLKEEARKFLRYLEGTGCLLAGEPDFITVSDGEWVQIEVTCAAGAHGAE